MAYRYWDYYSNTGTSSTATPYYTGWDTGTTGTSTTWYTTNTACYSRVQEYLITGFDNWSEEARATLTRLVNDETRTGFRIKMWIKGDIDITDMNIQVRDVDWFLLKLRQVAAPEDYQKIADCIRTAREEAAVHHDTPEGQP